jgi:hypothetical protein
MNGPIDSKGLSTFELAELLESIPESSAVLAKRLGRSRTYVSKMRSTMRNACPSLLTAWKGGELAYDVVKTLARIDDAREQSRALIAYTEATRGRTRAAKGEARAAAQEKADRLSAEQEEIDCARNSEECAHCGHMRCQHEPYCWCGDHKFVEATK